MVFRNLFIFSTRAIRIFSFLSTFLFLATLPALAEDGWAGVQSSLEGGEEVVILPLPSEIPAEFVEEQPLVQPNLYFNGIQGDGGSVAQAMWVLPSLSAGENGVVEVTPFLALNGQDDGTRQGQTLAGGGGVVLSLGERIQGKFGWERTIYPFPYTSMQVSGSFQF